VACGRKRQRYGKSGCENASARRRARHERVFFSALQWQALQWGNNRRRSAFDRATSKRSLLRELGGDRPRASSIILDLALVSPSRSRPPPLPLDEMKRAPTSVSRGTKERRNEGTKERRNERMDGQHFSRAILYHFLVFFLWLHER